MGSFPLRACCADAATDRVPIDHRAVHHSATASNRCIAELNNRLRRLRPMTPAAITFERGRGAVISSTEVWPVSVMPAWTTAISASSSKSAASPSGSPHRRRAVSRLCVAGAGRIGLFCEQEAAASDLAGAIWRDALPTWCARHRRPNG